MPRARDLRVALGCDWGNASPGCVVWGAALPNGHVTLFDELKFQRMSARDVADLIKAKCREWDLPRVPQIYCDPSIMPAVKGERGEWIGVTLGRHLGTMPTRAPNDRVNGWQRVHEALGIDPVTKTPWMTVHPRCRYLVRTFPLMVQSKNNPEDMDSDTDDHGLDAVRYLLAGGLRPSAPRPMVSEVVPMSAKWWRRMYGDDRPTGVLRT